MQLPQTSRVRQLNQINTVGATRVSAFIRFAFNSKGENTDTRIMSVAGVRRIKRPSSPKSMEGKKIFTTGATATMNGRRRQHGRTHRPLPQPSERRWERADVDEDADVKQRENNCSDGTRHSYVLLSFPDEFSRPHSSLTYRQRALLQLKASPITARRVCFFFLSSSRTVSESHRQMMFDFRTLETFNGVHSAINLAGGVG